MAKRNLVTNEIKTGGGGSNTKKATGGGMGYTATATNRKTGQKTTKSGTLTTTSASDFKSSGKVMETKKMLKKATPINKGKASGTGGLQSRTSKHTTRKID